jgi:hypothetical protein
MLTGPVFRMGCSMSKCTCGVGGFRVCQAAAGVSVNSLPKRSRQPPGRANILRMIDQCFGRYGSTHKGSQAIPGTNKWFLPGGVNENGSLDFDERDRLWVGREAGLSSWSGHSAEAMDPAIVAMTHMVHRHRNRASHRCPLPGNEQAGEGRCSGPPGGSAHKTQHCSRTTKLFCNVFVNRANAWRD